MPAPKFTTNPADIRLEGLYIFEQNPPAFISGVFLGVVGVAGQTLRGPVNTPVSITSQARFTEVFGHRSRVGNTTSVNKVREFMLNKRFGEVVVVRAAAADATTAEMDFVETATPVMNVAANSPGAWAGDLTVAVEAASDTTLAATHFNLVATYRGEAVTYENLSVETGFNNLEEVIGSDYGNFIVATKLADGRPDNAAAAVLTDTAASDGSIGDSDYTAANGPIETIANYNGVSICAVADRSNDNINDKMDLEAVASSDRMFLIQSGNSADSVATVVAAVDDYRSDRAIYCYNHAKVTDFDTATEIIVPCHSFMASILSQTDVDVHPGSEQTKEYTAGINSLVQTGLTRANYIALKEAGISSLERDSDGAHVFVSGVTTSLVSGLTEITRRRMADFLQLSAAGRLKYYVKSKNTLTNRIAVGSELTAFSKGLQDAERVIEEFEVVQDAVNTEASRAQGKEAILWRVKLVGHMLYVILSTEIGTTVTFKEVS